MRAARAAMIGNLGTAKLGLASDEEFKSKSVIVAEQVSKSFPAHPEPVEGREGSPSAHTSTCSARADKGARPIIKNFSLRIQRGDRIGIVGANGRSEEHTSELQSLMRISYAVFC